MEDDTCVDNQKVHDMILENCHLKLSEIGKGLGISHEWIFYSLMEELCMNKLSEKWVHDWVAADLNKAEYKFWTKFSPFPAKSNWYCVSICDHWWNVCALLHTRIKIMETSRPSTSKDCEVCCKESRQCSGILMV